MSTFRGRGGRIGRGSSWRGGWRGGRGGISPPPAFYGDRGVSYGEVGGPLVLNTPSPNVEPIGTHLEPLRNAVNSPSTSGAVPTMSGPEFRVDVDLTMPDQNSHLGMHGGGGGGGGGGREGSGDKSEEQYSRQVYIQVKNLSLTWDEVMTVNRQVILMLRVVPGSQERYLCTLCQSILGDATIKMHANSPEHVKKIKLCTVVDKTHPLLCSCCCSLLSNANMFKTHMEGKKHKQNLGTMSKFKGQWTEPIGNRLDAFVKSESPVVQEGDGQSLGLTPTMRKFQADIGPYIGLCYAQETGSSDGTAPVYYCTLCGVRSDPGNRLHFTSAAHRMSVLEKDYPGKHKLVSEFSSGKKRGEVHAKLKEIAAEIEAAEGRKVELIKRRILENQNKGSNSGKNLIPGLDLKRGRGRGRGDKPAGARGGRGRGRGRGFMSDMSLKPYGGYGGYSSPSQQSFRDHPHGVQAGPIGQPGPYLPRQHDYGPSGAYGSGAGRGEFGTRFHPYARPVGRVQGGTAPGMGGYSGGGAGIGREGYEQGGGMPAGNVPVGGWGAPPVANLVANLGGAWGRGGVVAGLVGGVGGQGFGRERDWSSDLPQQQIPAKVGVEQNKGLQVAIQKMSGDKTEALKALAITMINSEEDAENAFQLSSALTQALLDFRMKSLDTMIPENPLTSLLKVLQKPAQGK